MTAYVLMAHESPYKSESWEPIGVFETEPSMMDKGRALIQAFRDGRIPWDKPGHWDRDCGRIEDYTTLLEVPYWT